jgi:hypothetical protein
MAMSLLVEGAKSPAPTIGNYIGGVLGVVVGLIVLVNVMQTSERKPTDDF